MALVEEIEVDLVNEPGERAREEIDTEGIEDLAASIKMVGLINPILVIKVAGRYEVVAGHRRLLAHKVAGLQTIKAIVTELEPEMIDNIRLDENVFREDLSAVEIGEYLARIRERDRLSTVELARKMNKTTQWVNAMLRLVDIDDQAKQAVRQGDLSYASALELQKIPDEDTRKAMTSAAVKSGANTRTVQGWVQDACRRPVEQEEVTLKAGEGEKQNRYEQPRQRCMLCGELEETTGLAHVLVHPKCFPLLNEMCKMYQNPQIGETEQENSHED